MLVKGKQFVFSPQYTGQALMFLCRNLVIFKSFFKDFSCPPKRKKSSHVQSIIMQKCYLLRRKKTRFCAVVKCACVNAIVVIKIK